MNRGAIAVFLVVAITVLGGVHFYLWARLVRDPVLAEPWRRVATGALVLLALSIPAAIFASRTASRSLARIVPIVAFTWLGLAFLLFCALAAADLARLAAQGASALAEWLRSRQEPPADPERRMFIARALAGTALAATAGAAGCGFRSATGPAEVTEVPVRLERLPPALSGFSIVQISDLHAGPTIREREVRRLVDQVNALRPDLVAITGDLADGSVADLGPAIAHFGRLDARHGVYFVTGNHEYYTGHLEQWLAELRRLGVRVLRNERVAISDHGASFDLAGIDDWNADRYGNGHGPDLVRALAGRDPAHSLVLLEHQPRGLGEAIRAGVELQLSGHTHGGQIFPFGLVVSGVFPYLKGLYRRNEPGRSGQIFVSRGAGYWGPPMRLGSPPEIARIVLTS